MNISVLVPMVPSSVEQVVTFAALVRYTAAGRLWQGQSLTTDTHHVFASLAGCGLRVPVGVGVSLLPLRHPFEAALQARSLAVTTGQPVVAGFGPGAPGFQAALAGAPYDSPLTATREYVRIVRALLDGATVETSGRYFSCAATLPALPSLPVEVGIGVLRERMAELAGAEADVAITWLTPARYLQDTIGPALRRGADAAGRPAPRLVAIVPVALRRRDREATEIAMASNAPHLQAAHYLDMLRRAGIEVRDGDLPGNARAAVAGGAFVHGDLDEVVAAISAFKAAGVDEVVLNTTGLTNLYGPQVALEQLEPLIHQLTR